MGVRSTLECVTFHGLALEECNNRSWYPFAFALRPVPHLPFPMICGGVL